MEQQIQEGTTSRLGDVMTLQRGFDLPSSEREPGVVPVVSSAGITGKHTVARVQAPGVVTGRYGTLGEVFFLQEDFWPLNTTLYVKDFKDNDPQFVYYLLKSLDFQAFNDKSSVPGLNRNHLHELPVIVPSDLPEQRAIAHILGTLDDKIELNRKMNATLDEIARTLFTSWFVTFDPVRAKAEGRQPEGMDAETAALFPDRFVDSELGPIPEGWEILNLTKLVHLTKGRSYRSDQLRDSSVALVTLKSFQRGGGYRTDGLKSFNGPFHESQVVKPGELVVALTDVTQAADVVGTPAVILPDPRYQTLVASLDVAVARPVGSANIPFVHGVLSTHRYRQHARGHTTGTTVLHLAPKDIGSFRLATPPIRLLQAFDSLVSPLLSLISSNAEQSQTLVNLRDALLPELLSGRIQTPVAEQLVEAAV